MNLNTAKMPLVDRVKKSHRKQYLLTGAVALGVIIVAGGSYTAWRLIPSASASVKQADALEYPGHYGQALTILQKAYNRAIFTSDKELLLSSLAGAEGDMGNNEQELGYLQQLNQMQPDNYATVSSIGDVAGQLGSTSLALSSDQQALALLKNGGSGTLKQAEITQLSDQIAELQQ